MTDVKKLFLRFYYRPLEPCFLENGDDKIFFKIPHRYYPERYKVVGPILSNLLNKDKGVIIKDIDLPDLSLPKELPYNQQFSVLLPNHAKMAGRLIDILLGTKDLEDLLSICAYCQLNINPYMFNYCLTVAILHRPDTQALNVPTFVQSFPGKFMDSRVFRWGREVSYVLPPKDRTSIMIPMNFTAAEWDPEQRLAYFREDVGVNLHHWHWHLVYPASGNFNIVNKDRRGELFYYMHQQIIVRYNVERLCNGLQRVTPYSDFNEAIKGGYFPKLYSQSASRYWPPRFDDTIVTDLSRPGALTELNDMMSWRKRYLDAVNTLTVRLPDGTVTVLDEETGIDVLGNIVEASIISPNHEYYGNLHNSGHNILAYSHDHDNRYLEDSTVMGDLTTAMRDPVFYRWHKYINNIFELYKNKLRPYGNEQLTFPGVRVDSVRVENVRGASVLMTHWQRSTVDLSGGLDFTIEEGYIHATFTHLQHKEYNYVIEVDNTTAKTLTGNVRIFMAPIFDENNQPLSFDDQRRHMIEMDKFTEKLVPGMNTIYRSSTASSVTIPFERTFPSLNASGEPNQSTFCSCGWPQHMLVPKGTLQGYPMMLFVMVSNWDDDRVDQDMKDSSSNGVSFCGIRDRKYPDRRAMGFPFDRPITSAGNLADFLKPNMGMTKVIIKFMDETIQGRVHDWGGKEDMTEI